MGKKINPLAGNREAWLRAGYALLRRDLLPEAPANIAISWSFPSRGGASRRRRTIGECHYQGHIGGKIEGGRVVLVSPTITDELTLLDTLLHEMCHAALPAGVGHRKQFSQLAKRVGLIKPWVATTRSPALETRLQGYLKSDLPAWPGGHLIVTPKEAGRQLKATCDCGRILRLSAKVAAVGEIHCGLCDSEFTLD